MGVAYTAVFDIEFIGDGLKDPIKPQRIIEYKKFSPYREKHQPRLIFSIQVSQKDFIILNAARKSVRVKLRVTEKKYRISTDDGKAAKGGHLELIDTSILHDDVCTPIFDEINFPSHVDEQSVNNDSTKTGGSLSDRQMQPVELIFSVQSQLFVRSVKGMYNFVTTSDVATSLAYVLDSTEFDSIVVDPPGNEQSYDQIIAPPYDLINTLRSLQFRYGIYKTGIRIFYDLGTLYVLDTYAKDHEYLTGDKQITELKVSDLKGGPQSTIGTITETANSISYEFGAFVKEVDEGSLVAEKNGNGIVYSNLGMALRALKYDMDGNLKSGGPMALMIKFVDEPHKESGLKVIPDYDELNSPFGVVSQVNEMSMGKKLVFSMSGASLKSFLPNKTFKVSIVNDTNKDEVINGNYRIDYVEYYGRRTTDVSQEFVSEVTIELVKNVLQ